jgi:hypothetical protein
LGRDSKSICDTVKESEHCGDIHRLGNLFFLPARVAELLHVLRSCLVRSSSNQLDVLEKCPLTCGEAGFVNFALDDCLYALICGSLNPQEVSVAVQSIRTTIQVRDVAGNHFFMTPRKMSLRKMNRV